MSQISPTPQEVRRIVAESDPVVRNLQITQAYAELAAAMAQRTGPGANWCAMAAWASKQAGQSIRREDLRRTFERLMRRSPPASSAVPMMAAEAEGFGGPAPADLRGAVEVVMSALSPSAAFQRTSEAVARGNRKVFEEIGFEFARFLTLFTDGRPDAEKLSAFLDGLLPGEPPDGQAFLRRAFRHYHDAFGSEDSGMKAELMLLANLEIGLHEQTRLQPEILEAMNAPVMDPRLLRRRLLEELFPAPESGWRRWLAGLGDRAQPLLAARDGLADAAQRIGRLTITEHMMTLAMPDGRILRLGQGLRAEFPAPLRTIRKPELVALLAQVDPSAGSAYGTGVEDWGSLPDRMHFIADLFRAYHFTPALFNPPFTSEQTAEVKGGRRPEGRL